MSEMRWCRKGDRILCLTRNDWEDEDEKPLKWEYRVCPEATRQLRGLMSGVNCVWTLGGKQVDFKNLEASETVLIEMLSGFLILKVHGGCTLEGLRVAAEGGGMTGLVGS